jgi:thiol-disulfide isomerase/thioredoxin
VRAFVERPAPLTQSRLPGYYHARALLAAVDGRRADAFTYFQQALLSRESTPRMSEGRINDPLAGDARAYFIENGGSASVYALWSRRPAIKAVERSDGLWETPKRELPSFALADLSGQTWKLKQFEGRSLLINLWATWCGPCRAELPLLQKLYEATKQRSDVQVLSFNVDEDPTLV